MEFTSVKLRHLTSVVDILLMLVRRSCSSPVTVCSRLAVFLTPIVDPKVMVVMKQHCKKAYQSGLSPFFQQPIIQLVPENKGKLISYDNTTIGVWIALKLVINAGICDSTTTWVAPSFKQAFVWHGSSANCQTGKRTTRHSTKLIRLRLHHSNTALAFQFTNCLGIKPGKHDMNDRCNISRRC